MYCIPFFYFFLLTIFFKKRDKCVSPAVYISALYTLASFCSILVVKTGALGIGGVLYTTETLDLGIIPTLVYCVVLTIVIIPFSQLDLRNVSQIFLPTKSIFSYLFIYFLVVGLLNLYLIYDSFYDLISGDFLSVRDAHYSGDENVVEAKIHALPFPIGYMSYLTYTSILALPMFFYSICFMNIGKFKNFVLFLTSLSLPLISIQSADRTQFVFFLLMLFFCVILFRPYMKDSQKKHVKIVLFPIVLIFFTYLVLVTTSRFGDSGNADSSVFAYAGQSYLNFCYYFDNVHHNMYFYDRVFPLSNHIFWGIDYEQTRAIRAMQNGFSVNVFPSFLGVFLLDIGFWGMLIYAMVYSIISNILFKRYSKSLNLGSLFLAFGLAVVPIFGVFYYYYYSFMSILLLVFSVIFSWMLHRNKFKIYV